MTQIRLTVSTKYSRHLPEGMATAYIKESGQALNDQVGVALSAFYAPLQLALEGGTPAEVERLCVHAEMSIQGYLNKARMVASRGIYSRKASESREPSETTEEKKLIYLD